MQLPSVGEVVGLLPSLGRSCLLCSSTSPAQTCASSGAASVPSTRGVYQGAESSLHDRSTESGSFRWLILEEANVLEPSSLCHLVRDGAVSSTR